MSSKSNCELCLTSRNNILQNIKTKQLTYCAAASCLYLEEYSKNLKNQIENLTLRNNSLEEELRDSKGHIKYLTEELEFYKNL